MSNKLLIGFAIATLVAATAGCATTDNASTNVNATVASTTRPGPDDSEITTSVDANGVKIETRVFHNNPRVAKVVVTTTRDGKHTTAVYAPNGESKDLKEEVGDALVATGNAIADGAGWLADKTEDVAGKTKEGVVEAGDKLEDAGDQTAKGAKKVGKATVAGVKTVGEKTAEGAKKAGSAIKKAVTP
ncbi:MAG: hypothetical protein ACREA9_13920 [Pyrinomonadaceae bacterium]